MMCCTYHPPPSASSFSALQRAENSSMTSRTFGREVMLCFSALQRAENSSIDVMTAWYEAEDGFQCSSASRKFLNSDERHNEIRVALRFSALQRAENSSIDTVQTRGSALSRFQCSSASRKFLNTIPTYAAILFLEFQCSSASRKFLNFPNPSVRNDIRRGFSALQRAENSSICGS